MDAFKGTLPYKEANQNKTKILSLNFQNTLDILGIWKMLLIFRFRDVMYKKEHFSLVVPIYVAVE